jgi:nucleoside-diphosphate-sugar epimerase
MNVLVTGGAGFIGSKLVQSLLDDGHNVRMLSRRIPATLAQHNGLIEVSQCDLLDSTFDFEKVVKDCSYVFNCAGELHNEHLMRSLHVDATLRLVQTCKNVVKASGKPIHFVQLSSVGAYGPSVAKANAERSVTEETVPAPVGTYEVTKTKADELIVASAEKGVFSYSILRPSNVYGAAMPNNSIRQWGRVIQKKLFFYIGAPGAIATYVHVDDVVDALMLCGFDERAQGEIFNISNDCAQEELVNAISTALGVPAPRLRVPESLMRFVAAIFSGMKASPVSRSRINALVARTRYPSDKLKRILGYQPTREVKETIVEVFSNDDEL